ncbi:IucA/IucC family protein [Paracoccus beibuensis]|uniref:IucA/IucC family protein n=1 Tax=Paracoccus beibuensis TaxID=547602 RepID=UPI0022403B87|nr:IucA/IucC family protein [Paracoccus beibuensis]
MSLPQTDCIAHPRDPQDIADLASLRALFVCTSRELYGGSAIAPVADGWIEIVAPPMATGLGTIRGILRHRPDRSDAIPVAEALSLMLDRMEHEHGPRGRDLARRVRASRHRIATMVSDRLERPALPPSFLAAEQAMIFGHWMHPCPKALSGMTVPEERKMTPDWRGALRLTALSVRADLIEATAPDIARDLPGFDLDPGPGRCLLPAHPLTWDRARRDPAIAALLTRGAIRDLGPVGPGWWATSSVRTLWRQDSPWQVKASLPVTITNSRRVNKHHELLAGAAMLARLAGVEARFGPMRLVGDPHWMTLRLPGRSESGLELIFRENPWRTDRGGLVILGLAGPGDGVRPDAAGAGDPGRARIRHRCARPSGGPSCRHPADRVAPRMRCRCRP